MHAAIQVRYIEDWNAANIAAIIEIKQTTNTCGRVRKQDSLRQTHQAEGQQIMNTVNP